MTVHDRTPGIPDPRCGHARWWLLKAGPTDYMLAMSVASRFPARYRETP